MTAWFIDNLFPALVPDIILVPHFQKCVVEHQWNLHIVIIKIFDTTCWCTGPSRADVPGKNHWVLKYEHQRGFSRSFYLLCAPKFPITFTLITFYAKIGKKNRFCDILHFLRATSFTLDFNVFNLIEQSYTQIQIVASL